MATDMAFCSRNLLQMPLIFFESLLKLLDPKDILSISKTCLYLESLCKDQKYWRKLEFNVKSLLYESDHCEYVTKEFAERGLVEFIVHYTREEENLNFTGVDTTIQQIIGLLPPSIENLHIPIFMLSNANISLSSLESKPNLKSLQLGEHLLEFGDFRIWEQKNESIKDLLNSLFTKLKNLESVSIQDCHGILRKPLLNLSINNKHLKELDMSYCWSLDRSGLSSISQFNDLETLKLISCGIDDEDMKLLCEGCKKVISFDVSWSSITNDSLVLITKNMTEIQDLNIIGCYGITHEGILGLLSSGLLLKKLYIRQAFITTFDFAFLT